MNSTLKYTIKEINDISFSGFEYTIPEDILNIINNLCSKIGTQTITDPVFQKEVQNNTTNTNPSNANTNTSKNIKKKKPKNMEISNEEWESVRTFQATKMEQKSGLDAEFDQIRLLINKITDKTYITLRSQIIDKLDSIMSQKPDSEYIQKITNTIYDLASTNKFYSKIFADLYSELAEKFVWINQDFDKKTSVLINNYKNIRYVDPDVDYNLFCDINKENDKRRAVSMFYVNLVENRFISPKIVIKLLKDLIQIIIAFINIKDKKNEVDELTENVAILYRKDFVEVEELFFDNEENVIILDKNIKEYFIGNETIEEVITKLAKSKTKDYLSLSNKSIFKFMDIIDLLTY